MIDVSSSSYSAVASYPIPISAWTATAANSFYFDGLDPTVLFLQITANFTPAVSLQASKQYMLAFCANYPTPTAGWDFATSGDGSAFQICSNSSCTGAGAVWNIFTPNGAPPPGVSLTMALQCAHAESTVVKLFLDPGVQVNTTEVPLVFSLKTGIPVGKISVEVASNSKRRCVSFLLRSRNRKCLTLIFS